METRVLLCFVCPAVRQFFLVLLLMGVSGVLGGLITGVSAYLKAMYADKRDAHRWPPSGNLGAPIFFLAQALTGFGGSIAALLVILWANRFPDQLCDLKSLLTLAAIGFVSGYVANRLLPAIAESVYNKLTRLAEETRNASEELKTAQARIHELEIQNERQGRLSTELVSASRYLNSKEFTPSQTETFKTSLGRLAEEFPLNRTLNLLLAALYTFAAKDHEGAVAILERFIAAKKDARQDKDEDTASSYWNIANDREEQFKETGDAHRREQAVEALRTALKIQPDIYRGKLFGSGDVKGDSDFTDLVNSEAGRQLRESLGA